MKIPISLAEDYVTEWDLPEAIREFLQNALDQENYKLTYTDTSLTIISYGGKLSANNLLMGGGTKNSNDKNRGMKGEGVKLAFLICAREGVDVSFSNGNDLWVPTIERGEFFDSEHLHIEVKEGEGVEDDNSVHIVLNKLPTYTVKDVVDNTLQLQEELGEIHETPRGNILLAPKHKGCIYCGGLFVSKFGNAEFGYDFKPQFLKLDRDRSTISHWDCQWETKKFWDHVNDKGEINETSVPALAEALHKGSQDVEYLQNCEDTKVQDEVFSIYEKEYSGKIMATDYEEKKQLEASGYRNVEYICRPSFVKVLKQSTGYKTIQSNIVMKNPNELLDDFKDTWYDQFTTEMLDEWDNLKDALNKLM